MNDADTIQPLNGRPPYEPGDAEAFFAHVGSGGKVEADDWMPDEYRAAVLKFVEMHANSRADGRAAGARLDHARARPCAGSWR